MRVSAKRRRQQLLHSGARLLALPGLVVLLAAGLPASGAWQSVTIRDPVRGDIGQIAAAEGSIKYRGRLQRALLIVECADGATSLSLTTADMYFGNGRSQVQWSIDGSKLEGGSWMSCPRGDCLALRGERAIGIARTLVEAVELRLVIDRGYGATIDANFDVEDGRAAVTAVGKRCGWLTGDVPGKPQVAR